MGSLTPLFLLAAASVTVPLWLHLFHRHQAQRVPFPALRYLARTERDHARRIRLRQLLLMVVRMVVLLLLVGAGARLFLNGRGSAHPATAVVIVLDNSMSSGLVVGQERTFDRLRALALRTIAEATPDDRIWVIRAGEPWLPAVPGGPEAARATLRSTEVSAAAGDLRSALRRAGEILATSGLEAREIHLLSDLQATAFELSPRTAQPSVPVVAWSSPGGPPANRSILGVLVGGGLPPLEGQRSQLTITAGPGPVGDTASRPVRVVIEGRIRGAAGVPSASATTIPLPPVAAGWVRGWVESDPDGLRADDRRTFAFRSREAPVIRLEGAASVFLDKALGVLRDAGRVRSPSGGGSSLVVAVAGAGLERVSAGGAALVVPPADPALLPSLNRRLADAGIPWRYRARPSSGEGPVEGDDMPEALRGTTARRWYDLTMERGAGGAPRTLASVGAAPWLIEGTASAGGRYLLVASPLDATASTLPVSTGMVRFLDWAAAQWAEPGGGATSRTAGLALSAPRGATHVRLPSDSVIEVDGTRSVRATGVAGFYTFMAGDSAVTVEAVNPPPSESALVPIDRAALTTEVGKDAHLVTDEGSWDRAVFRVRQGPELWWPLLLAAGLLLVVESLLAAAGRVSRTGTRDG